jgi:RND family efflux transporter MFP subunit
VRAWPVLAVLLLATSVGCTKLVEEEPTPTPLATPSDANKPIYTVKRGSIVEQVKGLGRVAATDEATLFFTQSGRLKAMRAERNQQIKKGDVVAELETGTLETQVKQARIQSEIAQVGLRRAVEKANTVDPTVKTAASKISQAEASRSQAIANLQKLRSGALPADLEAANATVGDARAKLDKAQTDLAKLKAPKSPDEVGAARAALEKAKAVLQQAQAAYDRVASRPDIAGRPEAVALQQATADAQAAQARLNVAQQGAKPEDVAAAEKAVQSAQAALDSAIARQSQVRSGPLPADIAAAQAAVQAAEATIATAQAEYETKVSEAGLATADFDIKIAQKQVELANVSLETLETQLAASKLVAPFDGIVTDTRGREGDQVNAYVPIVTVANPRTILVAVELNQQDLAKVKLGQAGTLKLDQFKGQLFDTKVIGLPQQTSGPMPEALKRTVKLEFTAPGQVDLGTLVNVAILTQKKDDVLMVPNAAVRRFGGRKYVQLVVENNRKREVDVEVGIQTDSDSEILKGVTEGQRVVSQ